MNTAKEALYAEVETEDILATESADETMATVIPFAAPEPEPEFTVTEASTTTPTAAMPAPKPAVSATAFAVPATAPAATEDVFSAANFTQSDSATRSIDDLTIELRVPNDEEFVMVSTNPAHTLTAPLMVVSREDGYGKSYHLLTPMMRGWAKNQPSLQKFCKDMRLFLFCNQDGEFGLWPIRDSFDNWSVSDLQVVETARKVWTRRYNAGKVRKAHTSTSIEFQIEWPSRSMFGADGILAQVFGEAFVISSVDNPTIKRLLR
jgi:hypothetical protein